MTQVPAGNVSAPTVTGAVSVDTRTPPNAMRRSISTAATGSRCCCGTKYA
jgi:hypothetical protein